MTTVAAPSATFLRRHAMFIVVIVVAVAFPFLVGLLDGQSPADVIEVEVIVEAGVTNVDVVVASSGELPSVLALADSLSEELGREVVVELQQVASETQRASVSG